MAPKRGSGRPKKRTEPEAVAEEMSYAHNEPRQAESRQAESRQSTRLSEDERKELEERRELEELRAKQQAYMAEKARGKTQVSALAPPPPPELAPRRMTRRMLEEEGVSIKDFLRLNPPEFRGEEGDDPQEFLEETEKRLRGLPCSDAKAIEMVGLNMKSNAWEWYQTHIEDRLYGGNPPTWEEFKKAVIDQFLTSAERWNRAFQFERLKQLPDMTVAEYYREFQRLSKYARPTIPTEAERIERFRAGLIVPIYKAMLAAECSTLIQLVDKAKQWEARDKEVRIEREEKKKGMIKGHSSRGKTEKTAVVGMQTGQPVYPAPPIQYEERKRRGQFQDVSVLPPITVGTEPRSPTWRECEICGRTHPGPCRWGQDVCYRCGQSGHYIKDCPQRTARRPVPPASQSTVQMERSRGREFADRGEAQIQAPPQDAGPSQAPSIGGRGRGRFFTIQPQEAHVPDEDTTGMISFNEI